MRLWQKLSPLSQAVPIPPLLLWGPALPPEQSDSPDCPCGVSSPAAAPARSAGDGAGAPGTRSHAVGARAQCSWTGRRWDGGAGVCSVSVHKRGKHQPRFGRGRRVPHTGPCLLLAGVPRACIGDQPQTHGAIAPRGWARVCFPCHPGRRDARFTGQCWPMQPLGVSWRSPQVSASPARAAPPENSHQKPLNPPPQPCKGQGEIWSRT